MISASHDEHLLTFILGGQLFGVPVLQINDVLGVQKVTPTPLSRDSISGVTNLRGRIVTSIDIRHFLNLPAKTAEGMNIVIEEGNDVFSLNIDTVGDVLSLSKENLEPTPKNLDPKWKGITSGVYKLSGELLVILNFSEILKMIN